MKAYNFLIIDFTFNVTKNFTNRSMNSKNYKDNLKRSDFIFP